MAVTVKVEPEEELTPRERKDVVADVTILPLGSGAEEVRFTDQGLGVDSDFSFTATIPR